jgi:hypothetical protein
MVVADLMKNYIIFRHLKFSKINLRENEKHVLEYLVIFYLLK